MNKTSFIFLACICIIGLSLIFIFKKNPSEKSNDLEQIHAQVKAPTTSSEAVAVSMELFKSDSLGWGYKIFRDDKLYVLQPNIPAVEGNKGFKTKEDAEKAAQLVIYKVNKGIAPPSVSVKELDSLGISK